MQAVIMAGGKGTRLRSITNDEIPKPMVQVCGKPILQWQVECLKESGIDEIIMIIGHLGEKITDFFQDGKNFGISITYYQEKEPLGTAGALGNIKERLQSTFVLAFGDVIFDIDVKRMLQFHKQNDSGITLFVHPNSHPYDSDLILSNKENRVNGFIKKNEKRGHSYKNLVNAGFYILDKSVCNDIKPDTKTDLEKDLIATRINVAADVYAYRSTEYIKDVGTPERIQDVEAALKYGIVKKRNLKNKQKCIFVDRDGTLNVYKGLLFNVDDMELEKTVPEAVKLINKSDYLVMVVTNQPVVARNMCSIDDIEKIHERMETLLGEEGAYLDDIVFCPHHPDKGYPEENPVYKVECNCRKPKTGMIMELAEKYNINLSNSWMIGDTTQDILTGINAGTKTALVKTGLAGTDGKFDVVADITGENLLDVIEKIIKH
ncbi:HAD-IIIA family hydrolase [Butyrivibrio fibrisolvens]|uniref:HAD-IIIA family hydrolase n=1 Tax=Butyrivibrio fibrisolvens TaxID=831 RepID=UPI00042567A1|nr:HAD-IIIA family hydrolase [Butyrivibrio fibrisolvens]